MLGWGWGTRGGVGLGSAVGAPLGGVDGGKVAGRVSSSSPVVFVDVALRAFLVTGCSTLSPVRGVPSPLPSGASGVCGVVLVMVVARSSHRTPSS